MTQMPEIGASAAASSDGADGGELFSLLLRLHPTAPGKVSPSSGPQVQAAFLDLVRQEDPALSAWLHTPNQLRPYTLSLLQGFQHLPAERLAEAAASNDLVPVSPEQTYWLRITVLDAAVFRSFARRLALHPDQSRLTIGSVTFAISRLISFPEPQFPQTSWAAYSSFAELCRLRSAQKFYDFDFATPTAFSRGRMAWGKHFQLFPEPGAVFESLARQWECFAPAHLRLAEQGLRSQEIAQWCEEEVIVARYHLETRYLSSSRFGVAGFQGQISFAVKGNPAAPPARWLSTLARFALFSGAGYKTSMGMGQVRCTNVDGEHS